MRRFSRSDLSAARKLRSFVLRLEKTYAPQGWWPRVVEYPKLAVLHNPPDKKHWHCKTKAECAFEVAVGAILTQNTAWTNVELALLELAKKNLLNSRAIARTPPSKLERAIKPSGYFHQKAKKLKLFAKFVETELRGNICNLIKVNVIPRKVGATRDLQNGTPDEIFAARARLLSLWGIGRETADTILLFALEQPIFVVDAYTRRLLEKLTGNPRWHTRPYDDIRELCEAFILPSGRRLPSTAYRPVKYWQDAHALIDLWGKEGRRPRLDELFRKNARD